MVALQSVADGNVLDVYRGVRTVWALQQAHCNHGKAIDSIILRVHSETQISEMCLFPAVLMCNIPTGRNTSLSRSVKESLITYV